MWSPPTSLVPADVFTNAMVEEQGCPRLPSREVLDAEEFQTRHRLPGELDVAHHSDEVFWAEAGDQKMKAASGASVWTG